VTALERTLHRDYYFSDAVFALERERIFAREWFCVGREEELAAAGDWITRDVAGESVLLVRTREGRLAAHHNVCRHRGARLAPECARGSFPGGIRCPYHSWTYTLEGALRTAPFLDDGEELRRDELSLASPATGRPRRSPPSRWFPARS
jgi:Rieske 2Fe-2S family protein